MMIWRVAPVRALAGHVNYVLAISSCTAFSGINAAGENPTESCGLLGADKRSAAGLPAISVAGCPTHEAWVIETLMMIANGSLVADQLDALARPRLFADTLVQPAQ